MMNFLDNLNAQQKEAAMYTEGPLLILAGAGSGKTRVLTCRIAYLMEQKHVQPWNILAITFTNKAAAEMRERVDRMIGEGAGEVWVSTFHSTCCRILRRFIDRLGFDRNFTIYDTDDSRQVIREVMRTLEIDPKRVRDRAILSRISAAKNALRTPAETADAAEDWETKKTAEAYGLYQKRLAENNALDFDDLLVKTVELFSKNPDVLAYYQDRFQYMMVDEYQDTNTVQFQFLKLLSSGTRNLCVVGDDDQSIYKFRGANIQNILGFEQVFPDAKVVYLEQNYRSTQNILDAANAVISHNHERKEKKLWTENKGGEKVRFRQLMSGYEEAEFVAGEISRKVKLDGMHYTDFAVLYRTNAQSRLFEEKFIAANIPYKIVGGVNFYARKEIKDLLAYLKTIDNGADDLAVKRILNVPKRGIGAVSVQKAEAYAAAEEISFYDALTGVDRIPGIGRAASKIRAFTNLIERLRGASREYLTVQEVLEQVIEETGYVRELEAEGTDEANARIENIQELLSKTKDYLDQAEEPSLSGFLQQVALVADIDTVDPESDYVLLMTLHSAKGLEFDSVYLTGMEDGLFPSFMSIGAGGAEPEELEEERRLCYVGITRAKRHLTLTAAQQRVLRGETQYMRASRFIREIPREMVELEHDTTDLRNFVYPRPGLDELAGFGRSGAGTGGKRSSGNMDQFSSPRKKTAGQIMQLKEFKVSRMDSLDYGVGDTVRHVKFGIGKVQEIKDGARDYEVTVDFEHYGVKRMFASFAKLKKVQTAH